MFAVGTFGGNPAQSKHGNPKRNPRVVQGFQPLGISYFLWVFLFWWARSKFRNYTPIFFKGSARKGPKLLEILEDPKTLFP